MTTMNELAKARKVIRERTEGQEKLLCAVSGGLDSMCLLHLLREMGCAVVAAHFNHQLRGAAADRDEAFVKSCCDKWGIPFVSGRGDVRALAEAEGLSLEEAGRTLRYAFLRAAAKDAGCRWILTAHHADDSAETILMNLVRGTGLRGLTGIPEERDGILRPFVFVRREELQSYAALHGIAHVEDETNHDPAAADRNLLRLEILPLLRQLNPRVEEHLNETARQLRRLDEEVDAAAAKCLALAETEENRVTLKAEELRTCSETVQSRVLLGMLDLLGTGRKDVGSRHVALLMEMVSNAGESGAVTLPHGAVACVKEGCVVMERRPQPLKEENLLPGKSVCWGDYTLTLLEERKGEGLALRCGGETLRVAPCVPSQRLELPESRGARSVKRLCVDRRISPEERDALPAVYADGRLAAVWRLGVDRKFVPEGTAIRFIQITENTKEREK